MRNLFIVFALTAAVSAQAATDCILEMNGTWTLNPEKSLDPEGLQFEVLIFSNTEVEQRYAMEFENGPEEIGRAHV